MIPVGSTQEWLINLSTHHVYWVYAVIIILACAEGPFLSMIFGILIKLDFFNFLPVYASLMIGDLLGDIAWYFIGRRWGHSFIKRFGKYFSITEENIEKVVRIFHKYKNRILFISKISNGFGFALVTLMAAGMTCIPFAQYLSINLIGQFIWTGILIGVGYTFGELYSRVDSVLGYMSVTAGAIAVLFLFNGYRKYLKNKAEKMDI